MGITLQVVAINLIFSDKRCRFLLSIG